MAELRRLAKIGRLVKEIGERHRLTLHWFGVVPDLTSDVAPSNRLHIIFIPTEGFGAGDELAGLADSLRQPTVDPAALDEQRRRTATEVAALERRLNNPGGGVL